MMTTMTQKHANCKTIFKQRGKRVLDDKWMNSRGLTEWTQGVNVDVNDLCWMKMRSCFVIYVGIQNWRCHVNSLFLTVLNIGETKGQNAFDVIR